MPVYDYKCTACGNVFEYKQSINDAPLTQCPSEVCAKENDNKGTVHRIFSKNIGLVFKGTGFYSTDYVSKHAASASETPASHGCAAGACGCGPAKTNVA